MSFSLRNLFVAILLVGVALTMAQTLDVISAVLLTYGLGAFSLLFLFQKNRWDSFLIAFASSIATLVLVNELLCWCNDVEVRGPTIFSHKFKTVYPFAITFGFLLGTLLAWILAVRKELNVESNTQESNTPDNAG